MIRTIAFTLPFLLTGAIQAQQTLSVDPAASKLMWTGAKLTGEHTGTVALAKGTIIMNGTDLGVADITVDMTSITVTDIEDPGTNAKLTGHLKSPDFFSVEQHPHATFKTTKVEKIEGATAGRANYRVTGDL